MKKARVLLGIICLCSMLGAGYYIRNARLAEDTKGPVLKAEEDEITVSIGASDKELAEGVTAMDDREGDVSDGILIESIKKKEGSAFNEFQITYVAFDSSSNSGRLTRTLIYKDYRQVHFKLSQALRFPENQPLSVFDYITAQDCLDGDVSPFVTIDGDKALQEEPKKGLYDCTLRVTNSVGSTTELPIQVEIYEDSFEERNFMPQIVLQEYLVYLNKGDSFDPASYLDCVDDKGTCRIDFGPMVEMTVGRETKLVTEQVANKAPGNWVNISKIGMDSDVDMSTPGVYSVVYTYTSEDTGYSCNAKLIVVVE